VYSLRRDLMMVSRSHKADLNTAPFTELLRLPQVGPGIASAIMAGRPYRRLSDLRHVPGIGEKLFFVLKTHVSVSQIGLAIAAAPESEAVPPADTPSAKLDLNRATMQELSALPGVGGTLAEAIVAGRPYIRLAELQRVRGVGPKLYVALRQHWRVPRAAHSIPVLQSRQEEYVQAEEKGAVVQAFEIDSMPSFDEEDVLSTADADRTVVQADPLEVETVQELFGPRIVDGKAPVRIAPEILEGEVFQATRLVTRELRRDWKTVEIEFGMRPRRNRRRLLGAAVIAALVMSVLQAYGWFGDAITQSIFSSRATDPAIAPTHVAPSATSTQSGTEPTSTVFALADSATSLLAATKISPAATLHPPSTTPKPTIAPSVTSPPAATREIAIPQSVSDLDPTVMPVSVLWMEDFEPTQFPWGYDRNEFWDSGIVNGVLRLSMKQRGKLFYSTGPAFHLVERDFLYEGDVIVEACTGKDYYGLIFKARLPDYYAATITCEGNYRLVRQQNDIYEDLRVAASDAVPDGPGVYRLGVLLQRDGFSLYVNGTYVDRLFVEGLDEVTSGEFGVFARSVESHQLQLEWDNLIATELQR